MPKISVIVPVYNVEKYIRQCIDSLLAQTLRDIEIILVENCSDDRSPQICDDYALIDDRIKVIHSKKRGLVHARKVGIAKATAEYIGYVDSDDYVSSDHFMNLYESITSDSSDIVVCAHNVQMGHYIFKKKCSLNSGKYDRYKIINEILPQMMYDGRSAEWTIFPYVWDKIYKRCILTDIQNAVPDEVELAEDVAVTYPYILKAMQISIIDEATYYYRQRMDSGIKITQTFEKDIPRYQLLYSLLSDCFTNSEYKAQLIPQLKNYMINTIILPRICGLLPDYELRKYLFPFKGVERGSRIAIYGAGIFGQNMYAFMTSTNYCDLIVWVDSNYKRMQSLGLSVENPQTMDVTKIDYVVVCIMNKSNYSDVKNILKNIGFKDRQIKFVDDIEIKNEGLWDRLKINQIISEY